MSPYVRIPAAAPSPLATEFMVRMRDGVRLATDVYLPGGDASAGDTILIRLPYDKSGEYTFIPLVAEYFMARGYRVVAQDVRGKFRSEGEALLFVNEVADGYDTIEWMSQQPWSNGRVAMWGDSYYGYTQWAAVASGHPALRAISPRVTGTQLGEPVLAGSGRVEWGITLLYPLSYFHSNDAFEWELDWSRRPYLEQVEGFLAEVGERSISFDQWYPHPVHLRRFPTGSPFEARPVPTLHTIGWWDNCAPLSWADHAELARRGAWSVNEYLYIDSVDHEGFGLDAGEGEERTEAEIRAALPGMLDPTLEFFEVFVRDARPAAAIPRVRWNLANTPGMRSAESWPPPGIEPRVLHATADARLVEQPDAATTTVTWTHDPGALVPSSAPNPFAFLAYSPDEAGLAERQDVLAWQTAPLAADIDLVGPVTARATISSDGPVMDFFVRLLDIAPSGRAFRIARGQVQGAGRVQVDLGQLGYRLPAGHSLRVHVSSSDFPEFIAQPGTGAEPWSAVETALNTQNLILGGSNGFELTLHVLPTESRTAP